MKNSVIIVATVSIMEDRKIMHIKEKLQSADEKMKFSQSAYGIWIRKYQQ